MRGMAICAVLVLLAVAVPPAVAAKEDFSGTITSRDGTITYYTWLSLRRDEIPFAREASEMQHWENVARLQLRAIARVDFDNSTAARQQIDNALPAYLTSMVRRATVTFRDGTVYPAIYLFCQGEWGNDRERGRLTMPSIASVVVNVASAAVCPACRERFADMGYQFCPYDGVKLQRPAVRAAVAPAAAVPGERRPGKGSGFANTKQWRSGAPTARGREKREGEPALQARLGRDAGAISRMVARGVLRALPLCGDWAQGEREAGPGSDRAGRSRAALD